MRPDRFGGRRPNQQPGLSSLVPFEPVDMTGLEALEGELATAGRRARAERYRAEWPDPLFAASLRDRLVGQLPVAEIMAPAVHSEPWARTTGSAAEALPNGAPQRLRPRVARRAPGVMPATRWTVAAVAAALIVSVIGLGPGRLLHAPAASRAGDVSAASLIRDGSTTALVAGTTLQVGDEIRTADAGRATLQLGTSQARLAGGSDVAIRSLNADELMLEQLAGRVYHRVDVPTGGTYTVATAAASWTAHGTAFDLDRRVLPSHADRMTVLALEHSVGVAGPGVSATVTEGRRAELLLGADGVAPDIATGPIRSSDLADGWLAANAALDRASGFSVGVLVGIAPTDSPPPAPTLESSPAATPDPWIQPSAIPAPRTTPNATPRPTPKPTVRPTAAPPPATAEPTPRPTPTPTPIAPLALTASACPGGTVLDWSESLSGSFHHYKTLWSSSETFSGASVVSGSASQYRSKTSVADVNATGARWYRTYAYDSANHVIGKSGTRSATGMGAPDVMGILTVTDGAGTTDFAWTPFVGSEGCFTYYKVVYSADDPSPSYVKGDPYATYSGDQSAGSASSNAVLSGTYWFRVQVVRATDLGVFIVAETDSVQHVVP
jgi:hypothetical protein